MIAALLLLAACHGPPPDSAAAPRPVHGWELTWLGVTTWLLRTPDTTLLLDAYLSRPVLGQEGSTADGMALLEGILDAEGVDRVDHVLVGHAHFDHAVDAGAAALASGAALWGNATTCEIAAAQGLPDDRCHVLADGDTADLGSLTLRAHAVLHQGPTTAAGAYGAWDAPPDPTDVGLAPHGGALAFRLEDDVGSVLFHDSLGPPTGDDGSGYDHAAALGRLAAGPPSTLWLGAVDQAEDAEALNAVLDAVRPSWVVPHHFDGVVPDLSAGLAAPFSAPAFVGDVVQARGLSLRAPDAYGQRLVFDGVSVTVSGEAPVRGALPAGIRPRPTACPAPARWPPPTAAGPRPGSPGRPARTRCASSSR